MATVAMQVLGLVGGVGAQNSTFAHVVDAELLASLWKDNGEWTDSLHTGKFQLGGRALT